MTDEGKWPKRKRGRKPKEETVAERIFQAHRAKLRQAEKDEPLTPFDVAARIQGLRRRQ